LAAAISSSELGGVVAHVIAAVERLVCMRRLLVRCSELQLQRVKIRVASTAAPLSVADEEAAAAAAAVLNPLLSSSWQNFVAAFDLCCTPCPTEPLPNSAALIPLPNHTPLPRPRQQRNIGVCGQSGGSARAGVARAGRGHNVPCALQRQQLKLELLDPPTQTLPGASFS
jgi:hypothetical protein